MQMKKWIFSRAATLLLLSAFAAVGAEQRPLEFHLTFDPSITRERFTGRVYVMLSKSNPGSSLPGGPNWFNPDPLFAVDVKSWKPGEALVIGDSAFGNPTPLSKLPKREYYVQGLMDCGRGMSFSAAEGNGWSKAVKLELDPAASGPVNLHLDQVFVERKFNETGRVKLVEIESKLLSAFHGRPIHLRAAVVLPESWNADSARKYPVVYEIPGFGGNHFRAAGRQSSTNADGVELIWVVLDPSCPLGHHVFADSANNGPCGKALIEELIPVIEEKFHGVGRPEGRFVTGHSSGGWSSLWLQVTYPDFFGGTWSTAPDPVDFRDFQRIDLTKPAANMFYDDEGKPRPVGRSGKTPILFYKPFSDLEVVMGHGGQLGSFEAVFGPRGADGQPMQLWDRKSGAIDPAVARAWSDYDISLKLKKNWEALGSKLAGKIHVYTGGDDTFYLESSTRLLGERLRELGSDAIVEIIPGRNHGTLLGADIRKRIAREMAEQWRQHGDRKQ
jgi:S-formylglutathione hydrolase FrmB